MKKKLSVFLQHAHKELQKYNSTKKLIHLQQMGEKLWNAYIYLLEEIKKIEIKSHKQVYLVARSLRDKDIDELGKECNFLHTFFYEGRGDDFWIKKSYYKIIKLIKKIRKTHKI